MNCSKCDFVLARKDNVCKKCGTVQRTVAEFYEKNIPYRSRFYLFFYAWIGAYSGKHLKYLCFFDEAEAMRQNNSLIDALTLKDFGWIMLIKILFIQLTIPIAIILGAYRHDANGYPVRYFGSGEQVGGKL